MLSFFSSLAAVAFLAFVGLTIYFKLKKRPIRPYLIGLAASFLLTGILGAWAEPSQPIQTGLVSSGTSSFAQAPSESSPSILSDASDSSQSVSMAPSERSSSASSQPSEISTPAEPSDKPATASDSVSRASAAPSTPSSTSQPARSSQTGKNQTSTTPASSSVPSSSASSLPPATPEPEILQPVEEATSYICNSNTGKFHYATCYHVDKMKESNKVYMNNRAEILAQGYVPCKTCKP